MENTPPKQALELGLSVHQMAGILPDRARELYQIPDGFRLLTGLAIGYVGNPNSLPEAYKERELGPRQRKSLAEFVFSGQWGTTSDYREVIIHPIAIDGGKSHSDNSSTD